MVALLHGKSEEKLRLLFDLYDAKKTGDLSLQELYDMMTLFQQQLAEETRNLTLEDLARTWFKEMDKDMNKKISFPGTSARRREVAWQSPPAGERASWIEGDICDFFYYLAYVAVYV